MLQNAPNFCSLYLNAGSGILIPAKWYMILQYPRKIYKIHIYFFRSMTNFFVKTWSIEYNLTRNEEFLKNGWNVNRVIISYYAKI